MEYKITHVRMLGNNGPHEYITHVGNMAENWIFTKEEVITAINNGSHKFYVVEDGMRYDVGLYNTGITAQQYLRTFLGRFWYDHLVTLPQYRLQNT